MRLVRRILLTSTATRSLAAFAAFASFTTLGPFGEGVAYAQNDISPRLPDVLLLLDTSGSMDYLVQPNPSDGISPMLPEDPNAPAGAACNLSGTTTVMTRWASLVSVLTGSFATGAFGCETLHRNETKFVTEFSLPTQTPNALPYDFNYYIPWHRIYSNGCTLGAIKVNSPQDWTAWGQTPFDQHNSLGQCLNNQNPANCCTWSGQNNDGLLDSFAGMVRFGMMTFDTMPDPSTGSTLPTNLDGPGGIRGTWSYFHGWASATSPAPTLTSANIGNAGHSVQPRTGPAEGIAAGCSTPRYMEVGGRNQAAPPWEGPLTAFGDPASDTKISAVNTQIQNQILSMRPYGATPIAGMLDDAREFLFYDNSLAPGSSSLQFGPSNDLYWQGGCRKMYMILLTDGFPNMDMRGSSGQCDATTGVCPYDTPENILNALYQSPPGGNTNMSVTTFVVGFALSNPASLPAGKTSCSQLDPTVDCVSPSAGLQACCKLQSLAKAGGGPTATAYFADNPGQLKQVLSSILSQIVGQTTARTAPVYSLAPTAGQGATFAGTAAALSYSFSGSFNVTSSSTEANLASGGGTTGPWSGNLVRERSVCVSSAPTPQPITKADGDDFAYNLNLATTTGPTRNFFTVIGPAVTTQSGSVIYSDRTIRPYITTDDGFGVNQPQTTGGAMTAASSFASLMSNYTAAFGIASGTDQNCLNAFGLTNQPQLCVQDLINWEIGGTNALPTALSPAPSRDPGSAYCTANTARSCGLLGAIYHSTPAVTSPPRDFLRDDSYTAYANDPVASIQPDMLYTATIDGQLHAFKVSNTTTADTSPTTDGAKNNELWSFFPPAVLSHLMPNYNSGGANLLDGAPIIADVPGHAQGAAGPVFQRSTSDTSATVWHRVLVASGGAAGGFYYALEITNPNAPQFLWQISTDAAGNHLFGATTPSPAIAIVGIGTGNTRVEVPVAILSGGSNSPLTTCTTPPAHPAHLTLVPNDSQNPSNQGTFKLANGFAPPPLHCWPTYSASNPNAIPTNGTQSTGNSVTIVRLDTGQVLAHITGTGYYGAIGGGVVGDPGTGQNLGTPQYSFVTRPFTSPITGIPAPYPNDTGQVADRVYVGDADGQLWRIDLSSGSAGGWASLTSTPPGITMSWDAYIDNSMASRESIQLPPVISRDPTGNVIINVATGDQNLLTSSSNDNRVWSLTETPASFNTSQNWYLTFAPGAQRVTGAMALFNEVLYFSTYTPTSSTGNVCQDGYPMLYGVDYRRPDPANIPYNGVPFAELVPDSAAPTTKVLSQTGANGSVIFGVAATEQPSCGGSTATTDAYFGSHQAVSGVATSSYQLVWQTGAGAGLTTTSAIHNDTQVKGVQNMTLQAPGQSSRIDSWAAIVE